MCITKKHTLCKLSNFLPSKILLYVPFELA
jgi:hypothetical protein